MALGAYGYAISILTFGFPVWGAVLVGVGASVVFALILGIPTLRLRADYLAIVTIAAAEILRLAVHDQFTSGHHGLGRRPQRLQGFVAALNPIPEGTYGFGPFEYERVRLWVRIFAWTSWPSRCSSSGSSCAARGVA